MVRGDTLKVTHTSGHFGNADARMTVGKYEGWDSRGLTLTVEEPGTLKRFQRTIPDSKILYVDTLAQ